MLISFIVNESLIKIAFYFIDLQFWLAVWKGSRIFVSWINLDRPTDLKNEADDDSNWQKSENGTGRFGEEDEEKEVASVTEENKAIGENLKKKVEC